MYQNTHTLSNGRGRLQNSGFPSALPRGNYTRTCSSGGHDGEFQCPRRSLTRSAVQRQLAAGLILRLCSNCTHKCSVLDLLLPSQPVLKHNPAPPGRYAANNPCPCSFVTYRLECQPGERAPRPVPAAGPAAARGGSGGYEPRTPVLPAAKRVLRGPSSRPWRPRSWVAGGVPGQPPSRERRRGPAAGAA